MDADFVVEAKRVRKELLASLKSKDALIKALKVKCRAGKETDWVYTLCLGSSQSVRVGRNDRL